MKTFIKKSVENDTKNSQRSYFLLLMFMVLSVVQGMAESDAAVEAKKNIEHENILSYVFMVVGFIAIVAIAWFSAMKKKSGGNETGAHHPPTHHHHHNIHDKRYGTHHAR